MKKIIVTLAIVLMAATVYAQERTAEQVRQELIAAVQQYKAAGYDFRLAQDRVEALQLELRRLQAPNPAVEPATNPK
jgi:hypothetical protein